MTRLESNIFPIRNLDQLSAKYRLYRIRGLSKDHPQYYQNRQNLVRRLSYSLKTPATTVENGDATLLALREDAPNPPSPFPLVRGTAYFDALPDVRELNFSQLNSENEVIATRFLQFMIQAPLSNSPHLWQPGAGAPFFEKQGIALGRNTIKYTGFSVRVLRIEDRLGLCVDISHKYVTSVPLPVNLTRPEFRKFRGRHCVYHYGHRWYEIKLAEFEDLTASEFEVVQNGRRESLLQFIGRESQKPIPQELANLPNDASVVLYQSNQGDHRAAPSALCYPILDTAEIATMCRINPLLKPHERYFATQQFVQKYLRSLRFSDITLLLEQQSLEAKRKMFLMPDYEFGNAKVLSVRGTKGAHQIALDNVGKARLSLLLDKKAGFYVRDPLQRQYLVLPQTVHDSFGVALLEDLRRTVTDLFPQERPYDPVVVTYDDRVHRTFVDQGHAILNAATSKCDKPGFAVVMIHDTDDRRVRQHDQLAAMVTRKFRELDITAAVMHSATGNECYELITARDGTRRYAIRPEKRGRLSGYLRNVALNKILLTNERWPFVLATPLNAAMTVGIDVKNNTAGFTVVNSRGNLIRTILRDSQQKEQLLTAQVRKLICEVITQEIESQAHSLPLPSLVVHRDGILWPDERRGIQEAIQDLTNSGILASNAGYAVLEVPKTSAASFRLYDVSQRQGRLWVENPEIGTYFILDSSDAYLCATGRAFPRHGTVQPVHVKYVEGNLSFETCLEDFFYLTGLTWSRPEDCAKDPITIKLTDRRLGEDASTFDDDALEYQSTH
ncbi:MAG TPA: hypothetical protein VFF39_13520 [Verrucomicrobiae bacterium]|nr:hypothetical protein [Verrucomicrobiae bacterium]